MKKDLVETSSITYKVKRFFSNLIEKIFHKPTDNFSNDETTDTISSNKMFETNSQNQEFQASQKKISLAYKLKNNEIDVFSLSDEETEEMIEYFDEYIKNKEKELQSIKKNIESMKK